MSFLNRVLESPSYGFERDGALYRPTAAELFREFFSHLNFFRSKKNWLPAFSWAASSALAIPFFIFLFNYFSWTLLFVGLVYSMVILGSHGTFWLHRHGTHRGFQFSNSAWRLLARNLVIKIVPEEIYIVSHHVHHAFSELPGDPYNVHGGWLYCFLADANHQSVAHDLSEVEYGRVCGLLSHTGIRMNTYAQYRKWGSVCHPATTIAHYAVNWLAWYGIFYLIGGHALATAIFGVAVIWAFGVRTFNFEGHGKGKDRRREGSDFNRADLSVNQMWPGYVAGEWHNNHHLYPNGARSGFLPYQLDIPWIWIYLGSRVGMVASYRDPKPDFLEKHYRPYLEKKKAGLLAVPMQPGLK